MNPSPNDPVNKARQLLDAQQPQKAEEALRRHLQRSPGDADALDLMGLACARQLLRERALYYFQQALKARPGDTHFAIHTADMLGELSRERDASDLLMPLAEANASDAILNAKACKTLIGCGRLVEAAGLMEKALAVSPEDPGLLHVQGIYFQRIGDSDAARRNLELIKRVNPGEDNLLLTLATALNYAADATAREQYVAHAAFGRMISRARPRPATVHKPAPAGGRKLRIGIISPDLRLHSVMYFTESILDHLDRSRFSVHCYATKNQVDVATDRARAKSDSFVVAVRADDHQLARRIEEDRIDILLELSGLFAGHSLGALALKPAPIQVTYIGYPNTTGVEGIDYRIVDSITDPPGQETYATETLVRMDPCFLCYRPDPQFHRVAPPTAERTEPFTFGCFNAAMKLSDHLLRTWAQVLARAPQARLYLKSGGMEQPAVQDHLRRRMAAAGIDTARVDITGTVPDPLDHLRHYRQVDLALDSFPYNGTTTTCEALFMGVPVLTLAGRTHPARVGASLLTNAGFPDLVCQTTEQYAEKAAAFAADRTTLTPYRTNLRERFLASAVCDGPAFGKRLGATLEAMWRAWEAGSKLPG